MQRETTQSKYRLVEKPQTDANNIQDNEVRITTRGRVSNYVQYSLNLLEGTPQGQTRNQQNNTASSDNQQGQQPAQSTQASQPDQQAQTQKQTGAQETKPAKKFDTIVLKATGGAITGAVNTAEVVKRRVAGLHQLTKLETLEIEDHWEPTEEGLKPVKTTRRVASISITLTRDLKSIDEKDVGYQEPLPIEAVLNPPRGIGRGFRGRGGFRGGRGRGGFRGGRGRGGFRGGPRGGRGGFRGGPRGRGTGPRGRGGGFRGGYDNNYGGNYGGSYGGFNGGFRGRGGPRGAPRGGSSFRSRGGFRGDRGGRGGL